MKISYYQVFACKHYIQEAFLPRGYPDSVSEDYLAYQFWDTMQVRAHTHSHSVCPDCMFPSLQAFCSSITGALATLAILKGVGVGDSEATPLAATLTWMLKGQLACLCMCVCACVCGNNNETYNYYIDGTGMLGRILFGWMVA